MSSLVITRVPFLRQIIGERCSGITVGRNMQILLHICMGQYTTQAQYLTDLSFYYSGQYTKEENNIPINLTQW